MTIEIILADTDDREDRDEDYHAIPKYAIEEHEPSRRCPCLPVIERCDGVVVVQHRERN